MMGMTKTESKQQASYIASLCRVRPQLKNPVKASFLIRSGSFFLPAKSNTVWWFCRILILIISLHLLTLSKGNDMQIKCKYEITNTPVFEE